MPRTHAEAEQVLAVGCVELTLCPAEPAPGIRGCCLPPLSTVAAGPWVPTVECALTLYSLSLILPFPLEPGLIP